MSERDIHFHGFGKLLLDDARAGLHICIAEEKLDMLDDVFLLLFTRRAYDLVEHTIKSINTAKMRSITHTVMVEQTVKDIPDLTEWPPREPK